MLPLKIIPVTAIFPLLLPFQKNKATCGIWTICGIGSTSFVLVVHAYSLIP